MWTHISSLCISSCIGCAVINLFCFTFRIRIKQDSSEEQTWSSELNCLLLSISCSLDVGAELKFCCSAVSTCAARQTGCVTARREQWCHSVCHLKQRCQMRQWRIKYRLSFCHPSSQPFIFFPLFLFSFLSLRLLSCFLIFLPVYVKASSRFLWRRYSSTNLSGYIASPQWSRLVIEIV